MKLWTIGEIIKETKQYFEKQGVESSRLDAEILLCHVLNKDRVYLYVNFDRPLQKEELDSYRELVVKRAKGISIAYILNKKTFFALDFYVDENVLVPRPETEFLVEFVLDFLNTKEKQSILDIGTGSGAIALSLADRINDAKITACDISEKALFVAKKNSDNLGLSDKVNFVLSDLFEHIEGLFDVIVSNPPYIASNVIATLSKEVRNEPHLALDGGADGLDIYKRIIKKAPDFLTKDGILAFEIGFAQANALKKLGAEYGFSTCKVIKDYSKNDRVVILSRD